MGRGLVTRLLAAFVAVVFGFVTIQPVFADPCPQHQPALAAIAVAAGTTASHGGHDMSTAAHHGGQHAHHSAASHGCQCLGACCMASPVALSSPTIPLPAAIVRDARIARTVAVAVLEWTTTAAHSLPYPTAPPDVLLA